VCPIDSGTGSRAPGIPRAATYCMRDGWMDHSRDDEACSLISRRRRYAAGGFSVPRVRGRKTALSGNVLLQNRALTSLEYLTGTGSARVPVESGSECVQAAARASQVEMSQEREQSGDACFLQEQEKACRNAGQILPEDNNNEDTQWRSNHVLSTRFVSAGGSHCPAGQR